MPDNLPGIVVAFVLVAYSIVLHELGHGYAAKLFGDETGSRQGRLTFNPVDHVDIMGTVILPILQLFTLGAVYVGWARPMVVDRSQLQPRVAGDVVVSLAGVFMNMCVAVLMAILLGIPKLAPYNSHLRFAIGLTLGMNVALTLLNLLPLPPLDGSRVVRLALPEQARLAYDRVGMEGFVIVLILSYTGILYRIIGPPLEWIVQGLRDYITMPLMRALS